MLTIVESNTRKKMVNNYRSSDLYSNQIYCRVSGKLDWIVVCPNSDTCSKFGIIELRTIKDKVFSWCTHGLKITESSFES